MSLIFETPERDITRAHQAGLADFTDTGTQFGSLLLNSPKSCPVYSLALDRVNGARDIRSCATGTGWRFLAGDSTQGAATHVGSIEGASPKLTGFSSEPEIADAIGQLSELASIPQVQNGTFKLRFLSVPCLRFEAFWLHGNAEDLVIPCTSFAAAPEVGLEMMQPYTATAFLNNIRQALSILNEATVKRA
jgi:hypothetical protein